MPSAFAELVDTRQLTKKIKEADHPADSSIDAIYVLDDGLPMFMRGIPDATLEELVSSSAKPLLRIFFLNVDADSESGRQYSENALKILNQKVGLSRLLLSLMYQESDWVGRFGNGCFVNSWSPKDTTFEMVYYHCEPELNHTLVNMISNGTSTTYFVVNPTPNLFSRMQDQIDGTPDIASRLFFPDVLIADEVLKRFSDAAAEKWEELACLEQDNDTFTPPSSLIPKVEDLSLEWLCLAQGLTSTSKQLNFLAQSYARFFETYSPADGGTSDTESASAVLIGINGREEKPCSAFTRGADDLLGFLKSKCQAQSDWIGTSRESTRMLMGYTQTRANQTACAK